MYSIFDHDKGRYLSTGLNSTILKDCLRDYLEYRQPDLEDSEEVMLSNRNTFEERADYVCNNDIDYIISDMDCCNFELIEHEEIFEDDF